MYGYVLVPDTIHFINVLNTERAKRARKNSAALFLTRDTIIMFCHIKKQDDVHPQKRLS